MFPLPMESQHSRLISQSFNNLQGCSKAQTIKGLHQAKLYLHKFGYLLYQSTSNLNSSSTNNNYNDCFDEELELAIKTYQLNFHLNVTGALDGETLQQMSLPRCGVPDIVNGKSWMMRSGMGRRKLGSTQLHTVSRYAFFEGKPKWPPTKTHLKYGFEAGDPTNIDLKSVSNVVAAAFARWEHVSHFTFEETQDLHSADLRLAFYRGDHGDGLPFDGKFKMSAHAFAPTDGRIHFDADETWGVDLAKDHLDVQSTAIHEIGHVLGVEHSSVREAIMWPQLNYGTRKVELKPDDIQGIQALYSS